MLNLVRINSLNQPSDKSWSLGLEIWQILIVLTIILTVASSLMWFTNLQPEAYKAEYLFLDKSKSEIFNRVELIKNSLNNINLPKNNQAEIIKDCYPENYINLTDNTDLENQILSVEQEIDQVNNNLQSKIKTLNASGVLELSKAGLDFSVESKADLEKTDIYSKKLQEIQQESIKLCQSNLADSNVHVENLKNMAKDSELNSLDNNLAGSIDLLIQAQNNIYSSVIKDGKTNEEARKTFLDALLKIITVQLNKEDFLSISTSKYDRFINNLDSLENWQKNFVKDKSSQSYPTVWVLNKNKN